MTFWQALFALFNQRRRAISNPFFTASGNPGTLSPGASATIRSEFSSIEAGFAKIPAALALLPNDATKFLDGTGNFSAASVPSYSTGTFTPVLRFGGASVGITYTNQNGEYTQIGNRVFYSFNMTLTSKGSSVGVADISGMPFTIGGNLDRAILVATRFMTNAAGYTAFYFSPISGGITASIREQGNPGVATAAATDVSFSNTSAFIVCGHYRF